MTFNFKAQSFGRLWEFAVSTKPASAYPLSSIRLAQKTENQPICLQITAVW